MKDFIQALAEKNIRLSLVENDLKLIYDSDEDISPDIISRVKENKPALLHYLKKHDTRQEYKRIEKAAPAPDYPVSNGQRRLWLASQQKEASRAYNLAGHRYLNGQFSKEVFEKAIARLVSRHEILRTVFRLNEKGEIRQVVLPLSAGFCEVAYHDFEGAAPDEVKAFLLAEAGKIFDLSQGPLFSTALIRLGPDRYVFSFNIHHIISDGWSMEILGREVLENYRAYSTGVVEDVPAPAIQYKDYAVWQQQELLTDRFQQHRQYWLEQLSGELPVLSIPSDMTRPPVLTYGGRELSAVISYDHIAALGQLCAQQQGTLFMGLLAVLNTLFYRYTGQEDIIIGSPVAGRDHADLDDQIGFYVNTLALRTRLKGTESFSELLDRVRNTTLSAYDHQVYPIDRLIDEMGLQRDPSRSPLYDVTMVLQNQREKGHGWDVSGIAENEVIDRGACMAKFDLLVSFVERADALQIIVQYNEAIYDKETVKRLINHFKQLLEQVIAHPQRPIQQLDYMLPAERIQLLGAFNSTQTVYPEGKTFLDMFREQVTAQPNHTALTFNGEPLTYNELDEKSNQLAHYLIKKGVAPETLVPICLERSAEMIISIMGILKAGAAYVPVDPGYPAERIAYMLSDTHPPLIISHTDFKELFEDQRGMLKLLVDRDWMAVEMEPAELPQLSVSTGNLAYVIYTSGSTGKPKGVMIEHGSLFNYLSYCHDKYLWNRSRQYKAALFTSLSFDLTVTSILGVLSAGGELVIYPQDMPVQDIMQDVFWGPSQINFLKCTPAHIELLHGLCGERSAVGQIIVGGEELKHHQVALLRSANSDIIIYNEYGPTEATVGCVVETLEGSTPLPENRSVLIGKPAANTQIYILDAAKQPVATGVPGELYIGGAQLARGYLDNPQLTAERFIPHPFREGARIYRTGDLARWLPDGNIAYLGRIDDQVKIRGFRVELGEIEQAIITADGISSAVVVLREDERGQRNLAAYFVSEEQVNPDVLRQQLLEKLPEYMVPAWLIQLDELPLTPNGKVNRKALPNPGHTSAATAYVAPKNEIEACLAQVWEQVFELDYPVGAKHSFFELGGSSLTAILVINKLERAGYSVSIDNLLKYHVLEDLARAVTAARPPAAEQEQEEHNAAADNLFGLSYNQQLYVHGDNIAHAYGYFSLQLPAFNKAAFTAAFQKLLAGHEVLRTKFHRKNGAFLQEILPATHTANRIHFIERDILDANSPQVQDTLERLFSEPFDLYGGEVMKCAVMHNNNEAQALFIIHHIVTDYVSNQQLKEIFLQYYNNDETNDHRPAYRDFIRAQEAFYHSEQGKEKAAFWEACLKEIDVHSLPVYSEFSQLNDVTVVTSSITIDKKRLTAWRSYCRHMHIFPSTLALGIFRYAAFKEFPECQSFIINVIANGRDLRLPGFAAGKAIGQFTNALPVLMERRFASPDNVLRGIQQTYLQARLHQEIHFGCICEMIRRKYGWSVTDATAYNISYLDHTGEQLKERPAESSRARETAWNKEKGGLAIKCYEYANAIVLEWENLCHRDNAHARISEGYYIRQMKDIIESIINHHNVK
ncbi:MAG TPA: amino acid adenylation domain-containing protein [Chitinophaga sp.]|uniref:non-ribosomal peptide synthetase n=1 Tax=Chitinophaga sp. TaxID=1869181 RepID=UPI002DBD272C|nr:non-ribosomal peptide synthetase [Chitinophaga sp.]HEU4555733.1 amino acid adenylation domain-containing protein [Chitinophaga sp.]